jgi:hypothetical protein
MVSDLFFSHLVLLGLVWLCLLLYWVWPSDWATVPATSSRRRRRREPTPFECVPPFTHGVFYWVVRLTRPTVRGAP